MPQRKKLTFLTIPIPEKRLGVSSTQHRLPIKSEQKTNWAWNLIWLRRDKHETSISTGSVMDYQIHGDIRGQSARKISQMPFYEVSKSIIYCSPLVAYTSRCWAICMHSKDQAHVPYLFETGNWGVQINVFLSFRNHDNTLFKTRTCIPRQP